MRGYFRWPATPSVEQILISATPSAQGTVRMLAGTTTVALFDDANAQVGSASGALALDAWHRIEMVIGITSGRLKFYVNGDLIAGVDSGADLATTITQFRLGNTSATASTDIVYVDDVAINDSTGGVDDGLPGPGKIILRLAASDYQRDAGWIDPDASATNLWDEVNNTPPTGTATPTNLILNSVSTTTETYTAETTTYAAGGITAADRVKVVQAVAAIGDATAAATRSLGLELTLNPTAAELTATTPNGALGTYPSNWITMRGTLNSGPSVTLTDPIRVRVRKNSANADALAVALLGVYVEYGPPTLVTATTATEADAAQTLNVDKARGVTSAGETDTAQALVVTKPILKSIAPAAEADAAQALDADKRPTLVPAGETDAAQALVVTKTIFKSLTSAAETGTSQALDADKHLGLSGAIEADAAQALGVTQASDYGVTSAAETDVAQALSYAKTIHVSLAPVSETDEAQALTFSQAGAQGIVPAVETDTTEALSVTHVHYVTLVPASETDEAQGLSIGAVTPPPDTGGGWVNVRRRPLRPQGPQAVFIFPAQEHDRALPLGFVKQPNRIVTEDDELLLLA